MKRLLYLVFGTCFFALFLSAQDIGSLSPEEKFELFWKNNHYSEVKQQLESGNMNKSLRFVLDSTIRVYTQTSEATFPQAKGSFEYDQQEHLNRFVNYRWSDLNESWQIDFNPNPQEFFYTDGIDFTHIIYTPSLDPMLKYRYLHHPDNSLGMIELYVWMANVQGWVWASIVEISYDGLLEDYRLYKSYLSESEGFVNYRKEDKNYVNGLQANTVSAEWDYASNQWIERYKTEYGYNQANRLNHIQKFTMEAGNWIPSDGAQILSYNENNRLSEHYITNSNKYVYEYDPAGNMTSVKMISTFDENLFLESHYYYDLSVSKEQTLLPVNNTVGLRSYELSGYDQPTNFIYLDLLSYFSPNKLDSALYIQYWADTILGKSNVYFHYSQRDVNVKEIAANQQVIISPNPTNGLIHLKNTGNYSAYEIRNIHGQIILKGEKIPAQLDLSKLESGVYFLIFENRDKQPETLKIIRQ